MKNIIFRGYKKVGIVTLIFAFIFSLLNAGVFMNYGAKVAQAAPNLIKEGSFEGNINDSWAVWTGENSTRDYEFYRSLNTKFGLGSYAAAVSSTGVVNDRWDAGLITKKSFPVESGVNYFLVFNARADQNTNISMFLENSANYAGITPGVEKSIGTTWEKQIVVFSPTASVDAWLSFAFGDLAAGNNIYLDGLQIFKSDINVNTKGLKGFIGDQNKFIQITNMVNFNREDVEIELPYKNNITGETERKRFMPEKVSASGAFINFYEQTYSGVAKVYVAGEEVGSFNYTVNPKIVDFNPSMARADEDLVITGSGFTPSSANTFLVMNVTNNIGKTIENWIPATSIDSSLQQAVYKLPVGTVTGRMYVYTSYLDKDGNEIVEKSNIMPYSVKPVISHVEWSQKGYEQVGDTLKIYGKGMSARPYVNFYDDDGKKVDTKQAKLVEIGEDEVVEVPATSAYNKFEIKVMAYGVESDDADMVEYSAKPKFNKITSKYQRLIQSTNSYIKAAKVGDKIQLAGSGLKPISGNVTVEFQGVNERIETVVAVEDLGKGGGSVSVVVPNGAQNGYVNINVNGEKSNYIPLEIIPTVVSVNPDPIVPGSDILITANGVGSNINLAKVNFSLDKKKVETVIPSSITYTNGLATVRVKAPLAVSSQNTRVNLEYDRWKDTGDAVLNVHPVVSSASINMDTKILTIRGYGFSIYPKENEITYKYADEDKTVIKPNVRMLGVYPTEEGQEIRIKIMDEYHYGYVQVKVNGLESAEANFGPVSVAKITRRVEYVKSVNAVRGVLYINGYNLGTAGGVKVGEHWADVHYRTNFFIIAVVDEEYLYDNPVIVTKE